MALTAGGVGRDKGEKQDDQHDNDREEVPSVVALAEETPLVKIGVDGDKRETFHFKLQLL